MIKHRKKVIITIIFTIQLSPIYAGDFFIGMRTWQADWAPGIIKKKEDDASRHTLYAFLQGNNELRKVPYATKSVSGFYGGPLVSYVTDNRKLSFSLVGLKGASDRQGYTEIHMEDDGQKMIFREQSVKAKPGRTDLDLTVAYALHSRFKIFLGAKRQSYKYDVGTTLDGSFAADPPSGAIRNASFGVGNILIDHSYGGPAIGAAVSLPLSQTGTLSFSLGYFIARGNSIESSISFESNGLTGNEKFERFNLEAMNTTMTLRGLTAEITYTSVITKTYYLQVGYRGQVSEIDMNGTMDNYSFGYVTARGSTKNIFRPIPYPGNKFMDRFSGFSVSLLYKI